MKRVLIIGADFAPSSLPPATRIRFFASHLHEFGWQPVVLTTEPSYYESVVDPENDRLLPRSIEIIRTRALPAALTRTIGIGDIGMRSLWHHWRALASIIKEQKINLIFIPVPPSVPMILGRLANMRFKVPYVIDFIDPWVTEYYWKLPKKQRPKKWLISYAVSRCIEPFALKRVQHITAVSRGTTEEVLKRYPWLSAEQATEIPYGGEAGDFDYLRNNPRDNKIFDPADGYLHVCYVGAYTDPMKGALCALFAAFRLGLEQNPRLFERLRLHFVGTTYSTNGIDPFRVTKVARDCNVSEWVTEHPQRIPYLDSLKTIVDSHGLVLLGSDERHYTASKVFPYLLAQRPLLAIFHEDSSVIDILRKARTGRVVSFNSVRGASERIEDIFENLKEMLSEVHEPQVVEDAFESYTAKAMAARLAKAFDSALLSHSA
ncbi:MAG TPA: glycosyltransferase [Pyrinomonadaceae bacterium]|nr:glycosyltransferase [Pyrinomonadaceae bacterium]